MLIEQALDGRNALIFEGIENQPKKEQLRNFLFQLRRYAGTRNLDSVTTWPEAFLLLYEVLKEKPGTVVLDEFQWMANYRSEIVAHLKMAWDRYLSSIPGVKLILCGSIASFMITKVVRSNALYGRADLTIHVKEFLLDETRLMLPDKGLSEIVEARMMVGGVPKYLELVRDHPSVLLAMQELAFRENGYFVEEYDRIFTSHFGKNPDYKKIVSALAANPYGLFRKELARKASLDLGGGLSEHLFNLEQAGFISSATPFDKGPSSRLIKYHLSDAYLRFYFSFIQPNLRKIRSGVSDNLLGKLSQSGRFHAWRGRAFEYLCLAHVRRIVEVLGFTGIDFSHGPYFRAPKRKDAGVQVDLLFDRADHVITICEMKCSLTPVGRKIIQEVERKAAVIRRKYPSKTIQKVLIILGKPTRELASSGYFYRIIEAEDLFHHHRQGRSA